MSCLNSAILPDAYGVAYIQYGGHAGWMLALAKELKAAGYEIELNSLL
jgi:hypothetical protein